MSMSLTAEIDINEIITYMHNCSFLASGTSRFSLFVYKVGSVLTALQPTVTLAVHAWLKFLTSR